MTIVGTLTPVLTRSKWFIIRVRRFSRRKTLFNWPAFCHDHRVVQSSQVTWGVHNPTQIITSSIPLTKIRIKIIFTSMSTLRTQKVCIQLIYQCINQELRHKLRTKSENSLAPKNPTSGTSSTSSSISTSNWVQNLWSETRFCSVRTKAASMPAKIVHLMLRRRPRWSTISVTGLRKSSKVTRRDSSKCTRVEQEPLARKSSS